MNLYDRFVDDKHQELRVLSPGCYGLSSRCLSLSILQEDDAHVTIDMEFLVSWEASNVRIGNPIVLRYREHPKAKFVRYDGTIDRLFMEKIEPQGAKQVIRIKLLRDDESDAMIHAYWPWLPSRFR